MKKRLFSVMLAVCTALTAMPAVSASAATNGVSMYRMYNYRTGEHFYTQNVAERNKLLVAGWDYEGVGWTAPTSGQDVYRLYNKNAGDHHYTTSKAERDSLVKHGWRYEGIGWKSATSKAVPLYREYNPKAKTGTHNYTTSKVENDNLVRLGWNYEGIAWYGVKSPQGQSNVPDGDYIFELSTGELNPDGFGYARGMEFSGNRLTFTGQVYKSGKPYRMHSYDFRFADDCLYYVEPTDVAPRQILTRNELVDEAEWSWRTSDGAGSELLGLNVRNGYVVSAYTTG